MELTKEYFDQVIKEQTNELKAYAENQTEALARIINDTVADPMEKGFAKLDEGLTVAKRVQQLEEDIKQIKAALHIA